MTTKQLFPNLTQKECELVDFICEQREQMCFDNTPEDIELF